MQKNEKIKVMFKIIVFLMAICLCAPAKGKIIYVDVVASGTNNGSGWTDAYNYLQDALADANTAEKPVEILIAQGIYKPDQGATMNSGDRSATFQLLNGVAIHGGYAGIAGAGSDARDIERYKTILSGDLDSNDIDVNSPEDMLRAPDRADNSYQVITGSGTDETAVIDGCTITSGNAYIFTNRNGGGLLNEYGSPQISNCTFINNSAQYFGGGIYNYYSNPTIVNCTFVQNSVNDKGGGIYNYYSNPTIVNCTLMQNSANDDGGGIYNYRSSPVLTNCTFTNNPGRNTGGGIYSSHGSTNLTDCTFIGNSARQGGGAYNDDSSATLINCTFTQNSAEDKGAGLYSNVNKPNLTNCTFIENSAGYGGGGIYSSDNPILTNCKFIENSSHYGGGIYSSGNPILTNCILIANSGFTYGGGMYNNGDSLTLNNCIIAANKAYSYGGGFSNNNCDLTAANCTFTGNSAPNGDTLALNSNNQRGQSTVGFIDCILWDNGNVIWNNDRSTVDISYSNIRGGWPGEGNIDADPLFANPLGQDNIAGTEDDDFRLTPLSPCIDTGDPSYAPDPNKTDLDGNPRIVTGRVDMGAYEFQGIIYVGGDIPENPMGYGTENDPLSNIQQAINIAKNGYTVLVRPGVYEPINFEGKAVIVAGDKGAAVIEAPLMSSQAGSGLVRKDADAVTFHTGEGPDSILKNFIIRNSTMAISLNYGSRPTISNITIVDNNFGIAAYENSNPDISNCIFWNNRDGDLFQCRVRYSCFNSQVEGLGNISGDPLFVDEANGDYHLKSQGWRWSMTSQSWTNDDVTSRCIDAGDPDSLLVHEPLSVPGDPDNIHGLNQRINMGAFGGTSQASMPPPGWVLQ